jgi:serine/threonine protein kinase
MKVCSVCHGSHPNFAECNGEFLPDHNQIPETAVDLIPGFHLDGLLTSTSSTATYRAREAASGRSCLIKIFNADEAGSERILREAKIAEGLFHPGIAGVYDADRVDDRRTFVASEDIDGRTLREVLDNVGSPDLLTTIEIVRQAAESLHALHLAGLIHGAINPGNIVLSMASAGPPVVRLQHPDFGRTSQRSIISNRFLIDSEIDSLRYFAPEQCSEDGASAQSDIYSLGIVFYEMLSGKPPFDATTAVALIHQQRNQQPPEVKIENFNLRMLVTHALTEALQKHSRLRQSSADLFARQLRHIEQLATHSSTPPPAGAVRVPAPKRMPAVVSSRNIKPVVVMKTESPKERPVRTEVKAPAEEVSVQKIDNEPLVVSEAVREPQRVAGSDLAEASLSTSAKPTTGRAALTRPIYVASRSRLRLWKKKLRSLAGRVATQTEATTPSIFESAKRTIADPTIRMKADGVAKPVKRRKIDWETPEDDIPSEAEVLAVLAAEGTASMTTVSVLKDEPRETQVVLESPVVVETPVATEAPATIETPVRARTTIVNEKPRVVQTRAKDQIAEAKEDRRPKMPAPAARVSTKAKAPEPAVAARIDPRMAGVEGMDAKRVAAKPSSKRSGLGFKVNLADLEEITLVRPPSKRIRIDWERAVPRPDLSNAQPRRSPQKAREIVFSPTILGDATDRTTPMPDQAVGIFSALDSPSSSGLSDRRAVILGGSSLALIALFLFAGSSVTQMFQNPTAADSVTASAVLPSVSQQNSVPAPAVSAVKRKAVTAASAPNSEKPVDETISISERVSRPSLQPTTPDVTKVPKANVANKPRAASPDESKSRTKESKTDNRKRPGEKVTAGLKPEPFTRPRIVKTEP